MRTIPLLITVALAGSVLACGDGGGGAQGAGAPNGGAGGVGGAGGDGGDGGQVATSVRVAQYNIALLGTTTLLGSAQLDAAVEVITRFNPDILAVNEIAYDGVGAEPGSINGGAENAARLAAALNATTRGAPYEHHLVTFGNSGVPWEGFEPGTDDPEFQLRGSGSAGQFNYALISRYPILEEQVRVIVDVPWDALPGNILATMESDIGLSVPAGYPLFAKGLVVAPVQVGDEVLHMVMNHPFPPVFNPMWPYRHFDELLGMKAFLDGALPGVEPLPADARFVIAGDLNVDPDDGDAFPGAITQLFDHPLIVASQPEDGAGTVGSNPQRNTQASACHAAGGPDPASANQFQLDYLMPSTTLGAPVATGVFWPPISDPAWAVACEASDHFMLWADLDW